jgi:hypothetical protein
MYTCMYVRLYIQVYIIVPLVMYIIKDERIDFIIISETWEPKGGKSLASNILFNNGGIRTGNSGHWNHGIALMFNKDTCCKNDFRLLESDLYYFIFEYLQDGAIYMGVYIPPDSDQEWIESKLNMIEKYLHLGVNVHILGDMNARRKEWEIPNDSRSKSNSQGSIIKRLLIDDMNMIRMHVNGWTFIEKDRRAANDHCFTNNPNAIYDGSVREDVILGGTDHRPIIFKGRSSSCKKKSKKRNNNNNNEKRNFNRNKLPKKADLFKELLNLTKQDLMDQLTMIKYDPPSIHKSTAIDELVIGWICTKRIQILEMEKDHEPKSSCTRG